MTFPLYFQILDNSWMQHLENMAHLKEGIHWTSVGQRDPLVEYRRRAQHMFEEMQHQLRRDVLRNLYHAMPIPEDIASLSMTETELTKAAKSSVDNADQITEAEVISEDDFDIKKAKKVTASTSKKKKAARKNERKNRKKGRR